jgi:alkaline phosphatase
MKKTFISLSMLSLLAASTAFADSTLPQANDPYFKSAAAQMIERQKLEPKSNRAKNIILMIGDGMGLPMVTAARIYDGQKKGVDGVSNKLAFELFPYAALSRTYSTDSQVTDSAPSATSMTTGVKLRNEVLGLNSSAVFNDCLGSKGKEVTTLFEQAEKAGKATGAITTTRITHATPAAAYAHTPNRDWEADSQLGVAQSQGCKDIADQLVNWPAGNGLEVAMGGGRSNFRTVTQPDPEDTGKFGVRKDGRDLTQEWVSKGNNHVVVYGQQAFDAIDPTTQPKVLALFERSHMKYELDRATDKLGEPSLAQMTKKSIEILSRAPKGYVLMIEGGRIDHAEHETNAARALEEARQFNEAVKVVVQMTNPDDTLVVVTADHSHTMTIAGYPKRDNPILGKVVGADGKPMLAADGKPYTTLGFANGPGGFFPPLKPGQTKTDALPAGARPDVSDVDTEAKDYLQQSGITMASETHGGEDVAIYAKGPYSYLFGGTVDENYTYHVMAKAANLGADKD